MDNGEEIPLLNESWSFMGIRLNEWLAGFMVMMLIIAVTGASAPRVMPLVVVAGIVTAMAFGALRRQFPDEERGVRNYFMVLLGFTPPGVPTPSSLQPYWSGAPIRKLKKETRYQELDLDELFVKDDEE